MAKIIEASENMSLVKIFTVQTERGDEYIINSEECVKAVADLLSDFGNELRLGWTLERSWFENALIRLHNCSIKG